MIAVLGSSAALSAVLGAETVIMDGGGCDQHIFNERPPHAPIPLPLNTQRAYNK
jgi:hypothetical protein